MVGEAGAALGPQLHLFRPDPQQLDSHFVAGFLRARQGQHGQRSGSLSRSDVHRVPLSRLPLTDQQRYGEAFRRLTVFEERASQLTTLATTLVQRRLTGLAAGTLAP